MISRETLKQIELLKISTRRIVDNLFAGDYFSIYKGRGTEFLEIREYSPGYDDIREIDWNVTARVGVPHVKKFREERDIAVILLIDLSGSMGYGSRESSKREKALELAALVGMSVIKRNNRLGLIGFTDRIETLLPPGGGRKQFHRVMGCLSNVNAQGKGTNIGRALKFLSRMSGKGTVVFLISDFMAEEYSKVLAASARRYDLIPLLIEDDAERDLPSVGLVEMLDSETGETIIVDSSDHAFIKEYTGVIRDKKRSLNDLFRSSGLDSATVSTNRPVLRPLKELFLRRARMRSRQ